MKNEKIRKALEKEFDDIYIKRKSNSKSSWKELFKDTIALIDIFSTSNYFWYLADFHTGVVEVGGDIENACSIKRKNWIGIMPGDIGKMVHPADVAKMRSFVVFIADYLAKKNNTERSKIKINLIFRMENADKKYTWRSMTYPAMHYEKNLPRFLLCLVSEVEHLVNNPNCVMYIYDSTQKEPVMYFCEEEAVQLRPLYNRKPLSQRELEVLQLIVKGLISKEIAVTLKISKNTVENHKQNIFEKTQTKNIAELVSFAHQYIKE